MSKRVAVIGASKDRAKFGNKAVRAFRARGYVVFPVNPHEREIEGLPAFRSVSEIPGAVDLATVYVPPEVGQGLMAELARKGVREVWLNPGADDERVVQAARAHGLDPVCACSILGIGEHPGDY
jgi:predicted CoA-binding protein